MSRLVDAFAHIRPDCITIADQLLERVEAALAVPELKLHSWHRRVKSLEGLRQKLARPERTYRELDEITDLIGVRGITYFEDQVDTVGRLLEESFTVDLNFSVDKRTPGDPAAAGAGVRRAPPIRAEHGELPLERRAPDAQADRGDGAIARAFVERAQDVPPLDRGK